MARKSFNIQDLNRSDLDQVIIRIEHYQSRLAVATHANERAWCERWLDLWRTEKARLERLILPRYEILRQVADVAEQAWREGL